MKKILVIDDDNSIRENIRRLFSYMNYDIEVSRDGYEGIAAAARFSPDIIICDVMMPEIDGYEVLQRLSCKNETSTIPFVFLTSRSDMSELRYGMELGADDYITKPYKSVDLIRAVETRLKKREMMLSQIKARNKEMKNSGCLNYDSVVIAGNPPQVIQISSIVYIRAADVYTEIYLNSGKKILTRKLLKEWEATLPEQKFLRIHNSSMINLQYMDRVEKWFNNSLRIYMKNMKEPLDVSKRYSAKVNSALKF